MLDDLPVHPQVDATVRTLEGHIRERPHPGALGRETVEALDVVQHALVFVHHPRGLELWREALWQRRMSDETREAVARMLTYLTEAAARGDTRAATEICDCLHAFVGPIVGGVDDIGDAARQHTAPGGTPAG